MPLLPVSFDPSYSPENCYYKMQTARLHVQQALQDNDPAELKKSLQEMEDWAELLYRHVQRLEQVLDRAKTYGTADNNVHPALAVKSTDIPFGAFSFIHVIVSTFNFWSPTYVMGGVNPLLIVPKLLSAMPDSATSA